MATRSPRKTAQKPVTIRKSAPAGKVAGKGPIDPAGPLSVRPNKRIAFAGPSKNDLVRYGRKVVEAELAAVNGLHQKIDRSFAKAV